MSAVDWNEGEHADFVNVKGYKLFLRASGPTRKAASTPAIIIEHGLGGSSMEWLPVMSIVAKSARIYAYERAGYYPNDPPTKPPTPRNIAADFKALLETAKISPPYLLVGHSYGGVLVRQYLADYGPDTLSGMVIVDSAPIVTKIPDGWTQLLGDSTYEKVVGIEDNHVFGTEVYLELRRQTGLNEGPGSIAEAEMKHWDHVALQKRLHSKQALADMPLSVIMCDEANDMQKVYDYGIKHGYGSSQVQEALRKRLKDMSEIDEAAMREHLGLSSRSRFVKATGKAQTHNSHMVDPSLVAGEISWAYRQCIDGEEYRMGMSESTLR